MSVVRLIHDMQPTAEGSLIKYAKLPISSRGIVKKFHIEQTNSMKFMRPDLSE